MRILIAAGGTGGHIYPGLAIADKIKKERPDSDIVFVGSYVGMEKNIVPAAGYPLEFIRARGFERQLSLETLAACKGIVDSYVDARKVLKKYKPDLVIGTGGFTCAMLLKAAASRNIPTMIHEQNAYPGKSNRMLGKTVDRVAISFKEAADYFPAQKVFLAGNPIRDVFKQIDHKKMRKKIGVQENQKLVVVMGGSQGAGSINRAAVDYGVRIVNNPERMMIHLTGKEQYSEVTNCLKEQGVAYSDKGRIRIMAYSNEVDELIGAADLVVSRSGAMSVAEIAAVGVPSILVPYPYAAGNHQEFNAKVITDAGGGVLIHDDALTSERLYQTIEEILNDENKMQKMRQKTHEKAILDADERIYKEISLLL